MKIENGTENYKLIISIMDYTTKNSGDNLTSASWMVRENKAGKPRYDLIPLWQLKKLAELYARWAEIYWDRNWEKWAGKDLDMFKQSAFRHFIQWQNWENDEDHWSAVIWNIMWYEHCKTKFNVSGIAKQLSLEKCTECWSKMLFQCGIDKICGNCGTAFKMGYTPYNFKKEENL